MRYRFVTVDVFTERRFGGNPLAVVPDAEGLTTLQMQAIASEFNLSETTFVLPPRDPRNTAQVRIFTPRAEIPFAGHPNVGTAFVLASEGISFGRRIDPAVPLLFEEVAGLVPVDLERDGDRISGARLTAPQRLTVFRDVDPGQVAEACSLPDAAIDLRVHAPCVAGCGMSFLIARVTSLRWLAAAVPRPDAFEACCPRDLAAGIHLYVQTGDEGIDFHSRMFAPLHGIPEDPATGSANVALAGLLARLEPDADAVLDLRIGQGFDMGRPSILHARAVKRAGEVVQTSVGGRCVPVMRGEIDLGT